MACYLGPCADGRWEGLNGSVSYEKVSLSIIIMIIIIIIIVITITTINLTLKFQRAS